MTLLGRWLGRAPDSETARAARHAWRDAAKPAQDTALDRVRWVVVDTETSGLDPHRDRILSIGACAIEHGRVALAATFEAFLRQREPSTVENVLVHGIGHHAQGTGEQPDSALAGYLRFARADVMVGYHTLFDVVMLDRAARAHLGIRYDPLSIDLGLILPPLTQQPGAAGWDLDRWLGHYRLGMSGRHDALADAFATAQLFLLALQHARRRGIGTLRELLRVQVRQLALLQSRA